LRPARAGSTFPVNGELPGEWRIAMSDCLHCDINELVRERIEGQDNVDVGDMVARMAESLAELIMLAPKDQWAVLLAEAIRHLGNTVIEDLEGTASDSTH
jgi:hypothetical protein